MLVPIREEGYHVFVEIKANGFPVRMLLDTGASRTVFDLAELKIIHSDIEMEENEDLATGLGSNQVQNFIASINEIQVGAFKLKEYSVGVLDLAHVNISYRHIGVEGIAGVLGSDILMYFRAVISYKDGMVTLYKP